jgi:NDP-sugar pyrophosphorylase family protein
MLQIVVPMGGKASRFQERGYTFPKPLIEIGSQSMIVVVLAILAPAQPNQFTFICRKEHRATF